MVIYKLVSDDERDKPHYYVGLAENQSLADLYSLFQQSHSVFHSEARQDVSAQDSRMSQFKGAIRMRGGYKELKEADALMLIRATGAQLLEMHIHSTEGDSDFTDQSA